MNPTMKTQTQTQTFNHLLPIDFDNVSTLPESHAWSWSPTTSPLDDLCHLPINDDKSSLPIIDIGKPGAYDLVRHACENWGAFQVINHGVPLNLFSETELQARRLFSLPMEQKHLVARPPSGIAGYGSHRIASFFPKLMWSEGYRMMGSPVEHARKLWPQDHAKFCEVMEQWQAEMKTLTEKIVAMMLGSLGLTNEEDMQWFKSVLHRAVVNKTNHRVSTAFFYGPSWDAKVLPLRKLVDSDHPPLYRSLMWKEYLEIKKNDISKALESIHV
ncbi:hypothetical protein V6N12_042401 [Hibiscus sabdariffa]|uniref:Non-haem dioxygenase N-terminal domain-containing protein n=1 Tax=Hibiscus sabdariffa TaxID=183260 RepID=A0ABR2EEP6_9ROSI